MLGNYGVATKLGASREAPSSTEIINCCVYGEVFVQQNVMDISVMRTLSAECVF
jgi:hypothetical protein